MRLQLGGARLALGMGVAAGVELDDRRAEQHRRLDLARVRLDEQRDADAGVGEARDERLQVIVLAEGVEPALGGHLLAPLGDDAGGVRAMLQRERDHLLGRRHLHVERQRDRADQMGDVLVDDVPPVLAQMRGDAVGARLLRDQGGADRVRIGAAARVPDRRDMVDVDAEAEPARSCRSAHAATLRLPGFSAGMAASSGGSASAG